MAVQAIPDGYSTVTPHLVVEGAAEAIEFYKKAFGAEEMGRLPMPDGKRLMHAEIKIGDSRIMMVDAMEEFGSKGPKGFGGTPVSLNLYSEDAKGLFEQAVAAGCEVAMPLEEQFWGDLFGRLVDPYGHSWGVSQHVKDVTPEEMAEAGKAAMAAMSEG